MPPPKKFKISIDEIEIVVDQIAHLNMLLSKKPCWFGALDEQTYVIVDTSIMHGRFLHYSSSLLGKIGVFRVVVKLDNSQLNQ